MHSQSRSLSSLFRTISLAIVATFVMAVAMVPAWAQDSVPPTAVQAAKMPAFASKLAHPVKRPSPPISPAVARARMHRGPLQANDIYDNGPINGNTDAWTINFGFVVSDTFTVPSGGATLTGAAFGMWLFSGDTLSTAELSITSGENGGTSYFDQTVNFTQGSCTVNEYGYNVCSVTTSFNGPALNAGTYWVNLQNASVPSGDPVYWDENSGVGCTGTGCPSSASESEVGTIPSEAFTILGSSTTTSTSTSSTSCTLWGADEVRDLGTLAPSNSPSGVAIDLAGNLYGTLSAGGSYAQGLLYELSQKASQWFVSSLYNFMGGSSGSSPSGVFVGPGGDLFGAASGGIQNCGTSGTSYCGLIFKATPAETPCATALCTSNETTIYQFTGNTDAWGGTVTTFDLAGNLYGIGNGVYGAGAIFELSPSQDGWTEKILYNFTGGSDGGQPTSLVLDLDGSLYGTTLSGGNNDCPYWGGPCGVVFQLVPSGSGWTENVVYSFTGSVNDGGHPGGLIQDSHGNLYGFSQCWTQFGGCWEGYADGLIFELSPPGGVSFLRSHSSDGQFCPGCGSWSWFSALTVDPAGNLYAAADGFGYYDPGGYYCYCGAVGNVRNGLQSLVSSNDWIFENLSSDKKGNLYGTVSYCGPGNHGMIWQYSP
ncbi:MAG: choice-of-anchor tandem repeat GloVer-containing protein [Candidatus Korobacteraceae bacterium]